MTRFAEIQSNLFAALAALTMTAMFVGASVLPATTTPVAAIIA